MSVLASSSGPNEPLFPSFRERFLQGARLSVGPYTGPMSGDPGPSGSRVSPSMSNKPALKSLTLDFKALPREDGPPSETQLRRQKYLFFEKHCSEVAEGLYLAGDSVAKNRETLAACGISHVLNCVGFVCKEYFKEELDYKTLFLQGAFWDCGCVQCKVWDPQPGASARMSHGRRLLLTQR